MTKQENTKSASPFDTGPGWRDTVINWEGELKRLIDDYEPYATLDQAIQKDAIQNSWDGRRSRRRATGWRCVLELHQSSDGHRFMTITDTGTTGLTGRVLTVDEFQNYLPEDEKWARFESLAFTHESGESAEYLGARGQGKFIFVGSSNSRKILYDSLRPDGTYRLGARYVTKTSSPVNSWDGDDAVAVLAEYSPNLGPLTVTGTRIIVDDPIDEVVEAMQSGRMVTNIADTWWPIIEKTGADIRVAVSGPATRNEVVVAVPDELRLPTVDTRHLKVWHRENQHLEVGGERYTIKRAHFVHYEKGLARPELSGVALIRGGMVVTRLEMTGVPRNIAAAVTGFVEFDEALDLEMKRLEAPNHYAFNLRRGVGLRVKRWVEDELTLFAAEKLGFGGSKGGAVERTRREAERRALDALNKKARELGLVGLRGGARGGSGGGAGGGRSPLPISIELDDPILPLPGSRRVEFEESIANVRTRVVNNTPASARVRVDLYLTRTDNVVRRFVTDLETEVAAETRGSWSPSTEVKLPATEFLPGPYVLRARCVVLDSPHRAKGWEERDAFKFWLAEDPPQGGIFDDIEAIAYPPDRVRNDAEARRTANGWTFQYNILHTAYLSVAGSEDELATYLFQLMVREMLYVDLSSDKSVLFAKSDLDDNRDQQRKAAQLVSGVLYDYYQGA